MARGFSGNLRDVAESHEQLFGGPAFVAASLFGDGLWTNIGLVIRVEIERMLFSQTTINEIGQRMGGSSFQGFSGAGVNMTLRQFQVEHMSALYPGISKRFDRGIGHRTRPTVIQPVGIHVRPQHAMGRAAGSKDAGWWMPALIASEELGTFIYKLENTNEANEDYSLGFGASLLANDYSATPQTIDEAGRLLYYGDPSGVVANTWEVGLPFGFVEGTPGRVSSFGIKSGTNAGGDITFEWTAPTSEYVDDNYPITGYVLSYRENGRGAWTTSSLGSNTTELEVTAVSTGDIIQVRVQAQSAAGLGQQAELSEFVTIA